MAIDWDDIKPKPVTGPRLGDNLETLSVAELDGLLAQLHSEIARVTAELERKRAHEAAAAALFKL
jgi:uncharacterized small protein (DUF1192 family)